VRLVKAGIILLVMFIGSNCCSAVSAAAPETGVTPESVIILWTDGPRLKAVNLTFFPDNNGPLGIVSVPVYTCLPASEDALTLQEFYRRYGREKLIAQLENLFGSSIMAYITIDQRTLCHLSRVIGSINMAGRETNLLDVFEGNYTDSPINLQEEIRLLAGAMLTPRVIVKLPEMIWIFSTQVDSNVTPRHLLAFYHMLRCRGPDVLQKKAVPGNDYVIGNRKYRYVAPGTWSKTLREVAS